MQSLLVHNIFSELHVDIPINKDDIEKIINIDIEELTGCKLYNKQFIIQNISDLTENIFETLKQEVLTNLIPEINFNELFNSELKLIFKEDEVCIYYNDVNLKSKEFVSYVNSIKHDYIIPKMYLDNIVTTLNKFINKDLSVVYNCVNIPIIYWRLFEIKCVNQNPTASSILNKYIDHANIISGQNYKKHTPIPENKKILIENEETDYYIKMEVFSYLSDEDFNHFIAGIEKFNKTQNNAELLIITLNNIINETSNKMIKFYFLNKLFKIVSLKLIPTNSAINEIIIERISEFSNDIYIIQSAGLTLSDEIIISFTCAKEYITTLDIYNMGTVD